ncbi:Cobalt transport protein (plasmid) [Rubrobacter radiotolerans]|uniref:Cobalt transport protein n=1 Tax=Rubrobacter radiotolerans TaxID=42256 RepID=A0A023X7P2_RUBRA|nr:energy-coupling factor transporter transmembrane component T [Rubrobacter radiotolerans]AHY48236.1 Cobalt transport protein [Rubrobacter radiotolerans]MDX5895270.1 energy-coupling factor transporter transmembrane component T [Rubrobacter radiotolerans]SMC01930.1 energy-coupling factor transport system permease protein [Rubrobacter radiotolerans DSM 5868]
MKLRVPVLYTEKDTFFHRRDPRAKWLLFACALAMLYAAPGWPWMVGLALAGLGIAVVAKVSWRWLLVLWLFQLPNFFALVIVPASRELLAGDINLFEGSLAFGLQLGFAWSAALFVSISLFSTMDIDEMTDGLRGLKVPEVVCFTFGYAFLLLYTSLADVFRILDAMSVKGVFLRTKNPLRFVANLARLMVPVLFTVIRRASTMMAVLEARGFSFTERPKRKVEHRFGLLDAGLVACGVLAVGVALSARFGLTGFAA